MNPALPNNIKINKRFGGINEEMKGGVSVISLITDFGLVDNFVGLIKAVTLKINPDAKIVDICHEIKPQDTLQAAFLLKSSFRYFPSGTVHLVVVDPGVGSGRKKIIVKTREYYFVAPDNGVLWPTLKDEPPREIIEITNRKYFLKPVSDTFHGRDIFAPIAAYASKGENISNFGRKIETVKKLILPEVKVTAKALTGEVIYTDRFGNLISNIDKNLLYDFIGDRKFCILIKSKTIDRISTSYCRASQKNPIALINSFDCLEIAINGGSAKHYLSADIGTKIKIIRDGS